MSACVGYLLDGALHEHFVVFTQATDLTEQGHASVLLKLLKDKGVNTSYMRGQEYDSAANMSGHLNGVQQSSRTFLHPFMSTAPVIP